MTPRDKRGQGSCPACFQLLLATLAGLAVYVEEQLTATGETMPQSSRGEVRSLNQITEAMKVKTSSTWPTART